MTNILHALNTTALITVYEQKLVLETFEELWFAPVNAAHQDVDAVFVWRTTLIIDIIGHCHTTGYRRSFAQLLENVS